jgi:adenine-specific DNA-methyltransferase
MILENLSCGRARAHKADRVILLHRPWPGRIHLPQGRYAGATKTGSHFHRRSSARFPSGPGAGRERRGCGLRCAHRLPFNYEAHASGSTSGRISAEGPNERRAAHGVQAEATGGNLFVIFGEPDIVSCRLRMLPRARTLRTRLYPRQDQRSGCLPPTRWRGPQQRHDGIACWFIDLDYNEESFFVRHAYFWA